MTIRVGIIGLGKIAQVRHIPEYLANPDAELYGFFDLNFERAKELADKYHGKAYETYQDMLADPTIEAISVCTANHVHAEITIAALKAGKHVLCEKPMAVTPEECEEMVATAEATGKYLMIGQNQRLAKAHTMAKELIAKGEIGKVLTCCPPSWLSASTSCPSRPPLSCPCVMQSARATLASATCPL